MACTPQRRSGTASLLAPPLGAPSPGDTALVRVALVVAALALSVAAASPAGAWSWARTVATDAPLRWAPDAQIPWRADSPSLAARARLALAAWQQQRCDGAPMPWRSHELTAAAEVASPSDVGQIGWIAPPQPWPVGSDVIAYTEVVHNAGSGLIAGFRMRMNGVSQTFCDTDAACAGAEAHLPTVLRHEWGHVVGLAHSDTPAALMYGARYPGEVVAELGADDKAGLCALYAPSATTPARTPTGPSDAPLGDLGCSVGTAAPGRPVTQVVEVFLLGLGLLLLLRRVRRSRHPHRSRRSMGLTLSLTFAAQLALSAAAPRSAHAFILARSDSGVHQRWYVHEVPYTIEAKGLLKQGISDAEIEATAARCFATWAAVQCGLCHDGRGIACAPVSCASHPLGMTFRFDGARSERPPVACANGTSPGPDNPTCVLVGNGSQIVFVDQDWPHGTTVIATTVVAANKVTGEIADADIQFNSQDKVFCVGGACAAGEYDLDNTLTHEIGHLLGLDHSLDGDATMFGGAPPGEILKRDLLDDDVLGVCTAYRQAFSQFGCPAALEDPGCCVVAPTRRSPAQGGLPLGVLLALTAALLVLRRAAST